MEVAVVASQQYSYCESTITLTALGRRSSSSLLFSLLWFQALSCLCYFVRYVICTGFWSQDAGYETIMMNSNPETVSTDYDTSSRLYFEPLTVEDVINVINLERPDGIIVQVL